MVSLRAGLESIPGRRSLIRGSRWGAAGVCLALILSGLPLTDVAGPSDIPVHPVLQAWLASASNLVTLRATVVQTRHLQAFRQPLLSTGEVWFANPGRFRWQVGNPPQSIALRTPEELLVLSPRLRRAERYPQGAQAAGPQKDLMDLLEVGFPRNAVEFQSRFELLGVTTNTAEVSLRMQPRSTTARRLMPELAVGIDPGWRVLKSTEMRFADGSRMRNEFHEVVTNAPMSEELFRTNLDVTWKVSQGGAPR